MNTSNKCEVFFLVHHIINGGVEKALIRVIKGLISSQKYKITVVSKETVSDPFFQNFFVQHNVRLVCPPQKERPCFKNLWNFISICVQRVAFRLGKKFLLRKADVLIDYFNGSWLRQISTLDKPKIIFLHGGTPWFLSAFGKRIETLDRYSKIIVISDSFQRDLISQFPQLKNKIQRIYNPIDVGEINKLAKESTRTGTGDYFVFLARLDKDKDHLCVINAFREFIKICPDGKIYFIGEGPLTIELKNIVKEYNLDKNIFFTGLLHNPYGYLSKAIGNILSSPSEGLSNSLIEAAALRVLNISSNCPNGPSEVLLHGKGGLLFPPGNHKALANLLIKVWQNKKRYSDLVEAEFNSLSRFDHKAVTRQIEEVIDKVVFG